ncbi:hypothetical protein BpHYR1_021385 [Brachionus plicatilis]|uniref:Uncharacterized protein n=1 Tax=Brachionus plicatilis TaxID=10195 RepID=A0A3M7R9Q0_BRAPC|nr:hypothetical protein BpHYR1_021385 [Brachionus plicatilis]
MFEFDINTFENKERNTIDFVTKFLAFESHASVQFKNYLYISFPLPLLNSSSTLPFPFYPLGRVEEKKGSRKGIYLLIDHIL